MKYLLFVIIFLLFVFFCLSFPPRVVFHDYQGRREMCSDLSEEATQDYRDTQWEDFNWYESCMKQWKTSPLLEQGEN